MYNTKRELLENTCAANPDLSPFVILKLSMLCDGVLLSERALDHLQTPLYNFGKVDSFGIQFQGRPADKAMPGAILLRDASNVYINYGETFSTCFALCGENGSDP